MLEKFRTDEDFAYSKIGLYSHVVKIILKVYLLDL